MNMKRWTKFVLWVGLCWILTLPTYAHSDGNWQQSDLMASLQPGDKAALLMVYFGTTHDDTRALTIDALSEKARQAFPQLKFAEAYTSRIVIRRLKAKGIEKHTPLDALLRLRAEGYTHVVVQSCNIIDGVEMESLRRDVASVRPFFKEIRVGTPLLYSIEDCRQVTEVLAGRYAVRAAKHHHCVFVGHGTNVPTNAMYSQMDYMMHAEGLKNFHVTTIEGYPNFVTTVLRLKQEKAKQITLIPFMFVAGDHAKNDIAGDWKQALQQEGFEVDVCMEGLGQMPEVQQLFVDHIRFILMHRYVDIMEKKAAYVAGRD